jgi:hypothetical protein
VSQDAWLNAKGISSIRSPYPEKRPKCGRILQVWANTQIYQYVSAFWKSLYSVLRHEFRLPTWGIHYTPFVGTLKKIFVEKKYFPSRPYNIGNPMRYLLNLNITKRGRLTHLNISTCVCSVFLQIFSKPAASLPLLWSDTAQVICSVCLMVLLQKKLLD